MRKIAGSGSGSIGQMHGSADPDPEPDPHQNAMDPQHCHVINKRHNDERFLLTQETTKANYVGSIFISILKAGGGGKSNFRHQDRNKLLYNI
jgi:hypothetical protein